MPEIKATAEFVIVEIISQNAAEDEELKKKMSKSGLLMPERKTDDPLRTQGPPVMGTVYSIGSKGQEKFGENIKVGDTVIFNVKNPKGFKWEDKKLLGVKVDEIIARLERE